MKILIWIVSLAAIAVALTVAASGPGVQFGWWGIGEGLGLIRTMALPAAIAFVAAALVFILSLWKVRGLAPLALIAVALAGFAAYTPMRMKQLYEGNPVIHDVTTDFENPPPIVAAADMDRANPAEYIGDAEESRDHITVAEAQAKAFPDIKPMETDKSIEETAALSRKILGEMGLKVLSDHATEGGWLIETAYKSRWFGFVDDFIVRIEPDENGKTRIDLRSQSRVGGSDLGANAARVRTFMKKAATKL